MKLHIGGEETREGWSILNIQDGPGVDFVGSCTDLSAFADNSVDEIYASHVFEHLSYQGELTYTLTECRRILTDGGKLMVSVPNLGVLCQLFAAPGLTEDQRFHIMRMIFGGQLDPHDFHKVGLIEEFLTRYFDKAGFSRWERVEEFKIFDDTSSMRIGGYLISLNMIAYK